MCCEGNIILDEHAYRTTELSSEIIRQQKNVRIGKTTRKKKEKLLPSLLDHMKVKGDPVTSTVYEDKYYKSPTISLSSYIITIIMV